MFSMISKTSILDLQTSLGGQNRSLFHQEHNCENTKVKQERMDPLKLKKYTFQVKKGQKTFFPQSLEVLTKVPSTGMARGSIIH